jgi:hypothetical protein
MPDKPYRTCAEGSDFTCTITAALIRHVDYEQETAGG